ncbi:unnamed protein product [Chrysodeixis includens]|uniref:Uncharacterized protein n=1 Tax=Chrysodeixis includens TaxID=689277 RepID=A0A9N8Q1T0_CHRIL|nr:unnamed protein product [Chrysodeixis includens]
MCMRVACSAVRQDGGGARRACALRTHITTPVSANIITRAWRYSTISLSVVVVGDTRLDRARLEAANCFRFFIWLLAVVWDVQACHVCPNLEHCGRLRLNAACLFPSNKFERGPYQAIATFE